ncbi:MAG: acyltransferase [Bacteroidales bacterium]|nr:acyltransferase [Bacteroidales bacterium]
MRYIKRIFIKVYYLKSFLSFRSYGEEVQLSRNGTIIRPKEISIGNNVFISNNFHISARDLKIGNNVMIGPNLVIECDNHTFSQVGKTMYEIHNERDIGSVTIEDDVWIGANVTILPNSLIAEGSIIGAGSIVNKPLPPYTICVGAPCKPIKPRFTVNELQDHLLIVNSTYDHKDIIKSWLHHNLIDG